jgi:zinc and cadmium transporter
MAVSGFVAIVGQPTFSSKVIYMHADPSSLMMSATYYTIASVMVVSLISVVVAIPFLTNRRISGSTLLILLSMSVGVLLGTVLLDFLPEMIDLGYTPTTAAIVMAGFLLMFVIEKFIHWHHTRRCENGDCGHSHGYSIAPLNLIGDGIHNLIDGLVIAGSYAVSTTVGIAVTVSVIFHEIPQEMADFGVLLYSGLSRSRALFFNLLSALTALIGAVIGIALIGRIDGFERYLLPFAAGNFIYIAASNLLPQLHRHCKLLDSIVHVLAIVAGVGIVASIIMFAPAHG